MDSDGVRKVINALLEQSPLVRAIRGNESMPTVNSLRERLTAMPVFDQQSGAQGAYDAAMNIGPMGLGKIVYHGSPHKFDKFDASKIGTGEGAQAYGHGVYMADSDKVAGAYADMRPMAGAFTQNGKQWQASTYAESMAESRLRAGKGYEDAIAKASDEVNSAIASRNHEEAQRAQDILKALRDMKNSGVEPNSGSLYKADLPDEWIPKMLDWDKPLRSHPLGKDAADILGDSGMVQHYVGADGGKRLMVTTPDGRSQKSFSSSDDALNFVLDNFTGADVYGAVQQKLGGADKATERLRGAGIPGIRYLDGGSRGAGQGSYNYVVFPGLEDQVKILERNGSPVVNALLERAMK